MTQAILDTHEFDRLYSEYKSRFIVIAYALLRDKTLAEDLVTDSFLLLWEKRREIQLSQDEFPAYILGIVRHKCIDALRERQTHLQIQHQMYLRGMRNIRTSLGLLEDCDLSKVLFHKDVEEIFRRRLAEMPELSAQIFIANRFEDQTYQQIAERYGISVRKVTREIQRCLHLLREDLGDYLPVVMLLLPNLLSKP